MIVPDVIELTRKLIKADTVNPPGNEAFVSKMIGEILLKNGFKVEHIVYDKNRSHLIAERGTDENSCPVVFSGHFDVVPLGKKAWKYNPFEGEINDGKICGRGSSDMKGGVAAMVIAAIQAFEEGTPAGGVRLLLTADEETGCKGAQHLIANSKKLGRACGVIVGEPTSNIPATGHKGGIYLKLIAKGKTAHSSMPHLGDNAVYKAARAISKIENFDFKDSEDELLGFSTINVGMVRGGINLNSVPDLAEFTIDARITSKVNRNEFLKRLKKELGDEIEVEVLVNLPAVSSSESDSFVQSVYRACGIKTGVFETPESVPYLTDGAVLQNFYGGVPVVVLGPGQPEMAHQTDEYCYIDKIVKAVDIYKNIILKRIYNG